MDASNLMKAARVTAWTFAIPAVKRKSSNPYNAISSIQSSCTSCCATAKSTRFLNPNFSICVRTTTTSARKTKFQTDRTRTAITCALQFSRYYTDLVRHNADSSRETKVLPSSSSSSSSSSVMLYSTNTSTTHPPHTPLSTTRLPNTQSPRTTTKKKIILYLGFQGLKYCGWQRNPNVWTVEDALQKALFDAGFISDVNMASLSKVSWAAAARTDRGVSAAAQIASLKVEWPKTYDFDPVTFVDQLRVHLPSDIVVYGAQQVVSSMNARTACNARSYEYLVPFDIVDEFSLVTKNRSFEQIRTELDCILAHFVGTHSFHNFTRPTRIGEAGLKRYIISFTTHPSLIEIGSRSFIRVKVDGQSFVLHQIRKMVSIALLVLLGWIESAEQQIAMDPKIRRNVPPVPAAGLCLDNLFYDYFNTRFVGRGNLEKEVSFDYYRSEKEDFKRKFIYSNPAVQELLVDETRTFLNGLKHNLCEDYFLDKAANALVPSQAFIQEIWKKELNETVDLTSVREEREDDLESD